MIYKFKHNMRLFPVDPNDAGTYLENLHNEFGEIDPKTIVDKARDEENILHECFEWNDDIAAEQYRIHQAKQIIRSIVAVEESENKEPLIIRAFVSVPMNEELPKSYHTITTAMENPYSQAYLISQGEKDIAIFAAKYSGIKQFSLILQSIEIYQNQNQ